MTEFTHDELERIWQQIDSRGKKEGWHGTTIGNAVDQLTNDKGGVWQRDSQGIWRPGFLQTGKP